MSNTQMIPAIVTLDEIKKVTSEPNFATNLIQGIQEGFVALEKGEFFAAPIQTMGLPPFPFVEAEGYAAQTCVKSGYFKGQDHFVIKVASGGHPIKNTGLMQVYSQKSAQLEALLLDDGYLTEVRTAASGALAARLLAPKIIHTIGVLGTGVQARFQLDMHATVTGCRNILVWGRTLSKVEAFRDEMNQKGWSVRIAEKADQLLEECELVLTVTGARNRVLGLNQELPPRKGGQHISCIGADAPGKTEMDAKSVSKADLLVADSMQQTVERGEFQKVVADGLVAVDSIVPLGKLVEQKSLHRQDCDDDRITIFDSSGVALQDCVVARMVVESLQGAARRAPPGSSL